ncbi:hypothetical protein [Salinispora mooreana]|uniref:hypothetical protein n=1 Tax=Salinispora mooreana TaxID=999545 RepID=UPI001CC74E39|nr:hypothetical protein [Salinispora mooreana]
MDDEVDEELQGLGAEVLAGGDPEDGRWAEYADAHPVRSGSGFLFGRSVRRVASRCVSADYGGSPG